MDEHQLKLIEATDTASTRGRWIFLVLQVTCILMFMALWHETPFAWNSARAQLAKTVLWQLNCSDSHPEGPPVAMSPNHDECHYDKPFSQGELDRAKRYIADAQVNPATAKQRLDALVKSEIDREVYVAVPFLGVGFDINDLSLLAGVTFLFLLLWFRFSLWREEENVRVLFTESPEDLLPDIYKQLGMSQVLTVPPNDGGTHKGFWAALPDALFWSPVVVQLLICINDLVSLNKGLVVNPVLAIGEVVSGWLLLGLLVGVTLNCRERAKNMDRYWNEAFAQVHEILKIKAGPGAP
jgi:hypothetical protein